MREDHTRRGDDPAINGDGAAGRSPTPTAHQSNGFTAVNGESNANSSFRPDVSAKQYIPMYANDNHSSRLDTTFHSHGWRPDDRSIKDTSSRAAYNDASALKRKRSISVNVDNHDGIHDMTADYDERGSPKRRTASTLDSAIDLTSPVTTMTAAATPVDRRQQEPAPIGPYARERSPIARGEPPPRPGPETVALLAESANKFHQTQRSLEAQQDHAARDRRPSSPVTANEAEQQETNASDDDDEPQGDGSDPKEARKRKFSNRTKTGCHTCRTRKKKCDERKPACGNCERGNFTCLGYGPKPPNAKVMSVRPVNVQPRGYETPSGPGGYYQSPSDDAGLSYSHWGRVPAAEPPPSEHGRHYPDPNAPDSRYPPPSRDGWHRHGWSGHQTAPSHYQDRFPPPDYPYSHQYHYPSGPALPPPQQPAPPPISYPFAQYNPAELYPRPSNSNRPPTVASSHSSSGPTGHNSQHTAHLALTITAFQPSEKEKMLRGQPFLHWLDNHLIGERDSCAIAVDCYNKGARSDKGLSREAKAGLFAQILDPNKRIHGGQRASTQQPGPSPIGTIKDQTIVESPFKCDYGYNIHLGASTVLQAGCYLQDGADITVGDRVIIGSDVKIHTLTASVDCGQRKGSQGHVVAGAVLIEDDVFIGANSVILPYCTVGRGAVVGAGSVVTRDVKENTVVAGNPAKFIRSISPTSAGGVGGGVLGSGVGEGQTDLRHAYEIQERNEKVKKRMVDYANAGFNRYSPRLI